MKLTKLSLALAIALVASPLVPMLHAADAPAADANSDASKDKDKGKDKEKGEGRRGFGGRGGGPIESMVREPEKFDKVAADLGLTDDQKAKIKPAAEETRKSVEAIRKDESLDKDAKRAKIMENAKKFYELVTGLLTPEQKTKLTELQKERMEKRERRDDKKDDKKPAAPAPAAT